MLQHHGNYVIENTVLTLFRKFIYLFIYSFIRLCNYKFKYPLPCRELSLSTRPEGNIKCTFTTTKIKLSKYEKNSVMQDYKITN